MNPASASRSRVAASPDGLARIAERIAELAERSLLLEVATFPKPGLVSHVDNGSHADMDASTFARSARVLRPYFAELADAGARDADMAVLRKIGLRAEHAMLAETAGINTHRGAIFGLGLLCAAAGRRSVRDAEQPAMTLGKQVSLRWGRAILAGPRSPDSHGERARRRYGAGGARFEAAAGFRTVYRVGLPALRSAAQALPNDAEAARVAACFALMAELDDTNLLHRGGPAGLSFARSEARAFVERGGVRACDWRAYASDVHRAFVDRWLSPGGAADLLAMTLFVDALEPCGAR